jgi:hypothetical protein
MMLIPCLSTLAIGISALYLCTKIKDDVVQLALALPALFCLLLSLIFAPWSIQLLIVIALLLSNKHTKILHQCNLLKNPRGTCHACVLIDHPNNSNDCFLHYK